MQPHAWPQVELEAVATSLNDVGMGVDFKVMKQATREVAADSITST